MRELIPWIIFKVILPTYCIHNDRDSRRILIICCEILLVYSIALELWMRLFGVCGARNRDSRSMMEMLSNPHF